MSAADDHERAKQIFLGALELPGEEREGFLDARCGRDARLRAEVDELLRANDEASSFLAEPPPQAQGSEAAGTLIGRYKLLQQIGEGGFGVVWMAEQQEPVRRKVALKIIKLGMDTKQVVRRFEAERQALARMDHPNIAKVLDGGATENGRPFFVMELVRGVPITEYCDEAKLSTRARLDLFVVVCRAVQHAHQKGIIHRDLKPSNVMVTLHDGHPVPMIIDFGIAKATSGTLTEKTLFTEFRQFVGTPQYMSPEQAEISGLDVDTRADVYSLGVLLYELLTGTTPFDSKTLQKAAWNEILHLIREVEPPRPSARVSTLGKQQVTIAHARATEPGALRRLMIGDLDWIVMKALEKERTRRYDTANGLAEDILRYLVHEPVTARPPSKAYRLRKFVQRNRVGVLAGSLVVLAILTGAGLATVGFLRARSERDRAQGAETLALAETRKAREAEQREREQRQTAAEQREHALQSEARALAEAQAARSVNSFFVEMLDSIDPQQLSHFTAFAPEGREASVSAAGFARDISVAEMLRGAAQRIDESFVGKPRLEVQARETIGITLLGLGLPEEAEVQLRASSKLRAQLDGERDPATLRARLLLGSALSAGGNDAGAEALIRPTLAALRDVHGAEDPRTLYAASLLGRVLSGRGEYEEAGELLLSTLEVQRRVLGPANRDTIYTLCNVAGFYHWQSQGFEGLDQAREAYDLSRKHLSANDYVTAEAESVLGSALSFRRDFAQAQTFLRSALRKQRGLLGEQHPSTLDTKLHLARTLEGEAHAQERGRLLHEALDGFEAIEATGGSSPTVFVVRRDLALHLFEVGDLDEAVEIARESLEHCRRVDGAEHARTLEAETLLSHGLLRLARVAEAEGRGEVAERAFREQVLLRRERFTEDSVQTCSALGALTRFLLASGQIEEAREAWQRIIDLRGRMSEQPSAGADALHTYADTILNPWVPGMRDAEAALPILRRANELSGKQDLGILSDLALACRLTGREDEARETMRHCLEIERGRAESPAATPATLRRLAGLLLTCEPRDLRDLEGAVEFGSRAVDAAPDDIVALELLALACRLSGREQDAQDMGTLLLEKLRERAERPQASANDLNSYAWQLCTIVPAQLRDGVAAVGLAERALELLGRQDPSLLNTLGVAQYQAGRFAEALETLQLCDRINGASGAFYSPAADLLFAALCLHELGNDEQARELLDQARGSLEADDIEAIEEYTLAPFLEQATQRIERATDPVVSRE